MRIGRYQLLTGFLLKPDGLASTAHPSPPIYKIMETDKKVIKSILISIEEDGGVTVSKTNISAWETLGILEATKEMELKKFQYEENTRKV